MSSYVYVKNPNGTTYVYENTSYWDKTTKSAGHKRKCIGKLRPGTDEIIPTRKKKASVIESNVPKEQCSVTTIGPSLLLKSNCIGKHKKGCKDNGTKEAFAK